MSVSASHAYLIRGDALGRDLVAQDAHALIVDKANKRRGRHRGSARIDFTLDLCRG
jgi:hypothetical protein